MIDLYKALLAAFIATVIITLFIMFRTHVGFVPDYNPITDLGVFAGLPEYPIVGWLLYFVIGIFFWGIFFAILVPVLPGYYWVKGLLFGLFTWLVMMVIFMPAVDHGYFAAKLGVAVIFWTCIYHMIHGTVLGWVYGLLVKNKTAA